MSDRELIRRDAEESIATRDRKADRLARHCLALLAELEQAERERDEANEHLRSEGRLHRGTEARLAKVPALVEALRAIVEPSNPHTDGYAELDAARAALADWEQT